MKRLVFMAFTVAAALAQLTAQPKTENAKLQTRAVNGALDASFRTLVSSATDPAASSP